jgi:hypothetical protein
MTRREFAAADQPLLPFGLWRRMLVRMPLRWAQMPSLKTIQVTTIPTCAGFLKRIRRCGFLPERRRLCRVLPHEDPPALLRRVPWQHDKKPGLGVDAVISQ